MKPGAGKSKGNSFEREVCTKLSLWVSGGARADIFVRNTLSGGKFTTALNRNNDETGLPGDVMAAHPLAFEFLTLFSVECKHHNNVGLEQFMLDRRSTSFLARTIDHTRRQASAKGLWWMVIAQGNRRPPLLFMDHRVGLLARTASFPPAAFHWHSLDSDKIMLMQFRDFLMLVKPQAFLSSIKELRLLGGSGAA